MVKETKIDTMRRLFNENGLVESDVYMMEKGGKKIPIITRSGIEKIQAKNKIRITYKVELLDGVGTCVLRAVATMKDQTLETFGSATKTNCTNAHYVEMAEKRARARAVLMLAGFYQEGCFSEDENLDDANG